MSKVIKANFLKRKVPSSLLGLALDGSRLEGVVLRRSNGSLQVNQRFNATLTLDPLTNDVELVGREILNQLEAVGIRERRCVVAVPLKWAMAVHVKLPELADADVASFLDIEAERGFPTDVAMLQVATSHLVSGSGEKHATLVGIPKAHLERLEQVLRAAKLKPLSFSLGIAALQPARADSDGVMALAIGDNYVGLQITCGGGVAALRALEGGADVESAHALNGELIAREARITLGQLPPDVRGSVKRIRIFGPREQAQRLADEIRPRFEPGGLNVEVVSTYPANEFGRTIPPDTPVSRSFSLVARHLIGRDDPFEFLPPKVSAWQRATSKYAPGRLRKVAAVGIAAVLVACGAFGYQQWQLSGLRKEWSQMSSQVGRVKGVEGQIRKYRPWFDDSFRYLSIMRDLANAFPPDGAVTAKSLDIRELNESRDPTEVTGVNMIRCEGNATSHTALSATIHKLNAIGWTNVALPIRGTAPALQFTFDFHRDGGKAR